MEYKLVQLTRCNSGCQAEDSCTVVVDERLHFKREISCDMRRISVRTYVIVCVCACVRACVCVCVCVRACMRACVHMRA